MKKKILFLFFSVGIFFPQISAAKNFSENLFLKNTEKKIAENLGIEKNFSEKKIQKIWKICEKNNFDKKICAKKIAEILEIEKNLAAKILENWEKKFLKNEKNLVKNGGEKNKKKFAENWKKFAKNFLTATIPNKSAEIFQSSGNENLLDYSINEKNEVDARALMQKIVKILKLFLVPIAVASLTIGALFLFISRGNEEEMKNRRNQIFAIVTGFSIFALATVAVDQIFFGESGEIFSGDASDSNNFAKKGTLELQEIFNFATSFAIILAIGFLILSVIQWILHSEDEGEIATMKKQIVYSTFGIGILVSAKTIIKIISDENGKIAPPKISEATKFAANWINFILGFIGVIAVAALVWGAVRLIANFGDDKAAEEAKNILISAAIGIVVAASAWTIIYFFINP